MRKDLIVSRTIRGRLQEWYSTERAALCRMAELHELGIPSLTKEVSWSVWRVDSPTAKQRAA
jgi:hypothetical protein